MILFKNVDISTLKSILEKGILPLSKIGGDGGWDSGNRANNSKDLVYLFKPIEGKENSFVKYGAALLMIDIDSATENELCEDDVNKGNYIEYVCDSVRPEQIKGVYIPAVFKDRIPEAMIEGINISWVDINGYAIFDGKKDYTQNIPDFWEKYFADTPVLSTDFYGYFRGQDEDRHVVDVKKVNYEL